jgi:hypothetical protein
MERILADRVTKKMVKIPKTPEEVDEEEEQEEPEEQEEKEDQDKVPEASAQPSAHAPNPKNLLSDFDEAKVVIAPVALADYTLNHLLTSCPPSSLGK